MLSVVCIKQEAFRPKENRVQTNTPHCKEHTLSHTMNNYSAGPVEIRRAFLTLARCGAVSWPYNSYFLSTLCTDSSGNLARTIRLEDNDTTAQRLSLFHSTSLWLLWSVWKADLFDQTASHSNQFVLYCYCQSGFNMAAGPCYHCDLGAVILY